MITYRSHVYDLVMNVSAEAMAFSSELSDCLSTRNTPHYPEELVGELPNLQRRASNVRSALEKLMDVLPPEVTSKIQSDGEGLLRHLHFIDYWLDQGKPGACSDDPIDVVSRDIPLILNWFEKWYNQLSPVDLGLLRSIDPINCQWAIKLCATRSLGHIQNQDGDSVRFTRQPRRTPTG